MWQYAKKPERKSKGFTTDGLNNSTVITYLLHPIFCSLQRKLTCYFLRKQTLYLFIFCSLGICHLAFAQQLHFRGYGMEEGLSHPGTYWLESIIQDRAGFMWFSTFNGLNRFDGKDFKIFQYNQSYLKSLGNNFTTAICEAEDGRIWIGTNSGIYIFDPETETFDLLRHDPSNPQSLCSNDINFINKDQDGNMWVGTAVDGVCRWSKDAGEFDNFGGYFRDGLVFFQQKNGVIWVGNTQGLHQKTVGKNEFRLVEVPTAFKEKNLRYASDIVELPDGKLMVSSNGYGLWTYDPRTQEFKDLTASFQSELSKSPYSMLADKSGKIWMGAIGEIHCYDPITSEFEVFRHNKEDPSSIPMFTVAYGYEDAAESLWFVLPGEGIIVSHSPHHPFEIVGNIDAGEFVRLDENRLLIMGENCLRVFDILKEKLVASEMPNSLLNASTISMALSGKNELWIQQANVDHIKVFNFETGKTKKIPGAVPWLKTGPKGRIWAGFKYFDETKNQWVNIYPKIPGLPDSSKVGKAIVDIYLGQHGDVWLATNFGIFKYNLTTYQGIQYNMYPNDSLSANVVYRIYPGEEGRFYLSTSNGLNIYDPIADGFLSFNESNGLLHNQVTTVVEDAHGNPWITTPKGLQKLNLSDSTFTSYGIDDGLPGTIFTYQRAYRDDTGHLYFSLAGKLIRFHPDSLKAKDYVAPVYLLDFYLNHKIVRPGEGDSLLKKQLRFSKKIQLHYNQADFGFNFIMPVFYKANEVQYYYQLAPYDKDWKSAGTDNEIHYTNMNPGNYTFRVKAKTADGFWSPNEASIRIHISPPFYRTWWAYLFYVIIIGSVLFGIRHFELRRQAVKVEAKRLLELNSIKSRLYTNITHEFRTPLTVIMGIASIILGHSEEKRLIERNSKNLLRLINQLLDLSKLDSGILKLDFIQADIVSYLHYLTESFFSMAAEKQIRLMFYPEVKKLVMDFDEEKIQHIIYNLLSNAIKFTPEGGKVILHLREIEQHHKAWLQIKISDTGVGISKENLEHIFDRFYQVEDTNTTKRTFAGTGIGLALVKELVELMGGKIAVESEVGSGTDFLILLPIRRATDTAKKDLSADIQKSNILLHTEGSMPSLAWNMINQDEERPFLLVIEDNRDVITYIESLLQKDFHIETARNGQEGIDKALELIPDIIISDVMMPEKDGYEVCQTLKNDERTSHIPIILLTAKATVEDRIEGLRGGADAYLIKPFHKEELFVRLEKLVGLRRALQNHYAKVGIIAKNALDKRTPSLDDLFLQKLLKVVEENLGDDDLGVAQLCRAVNRSNTQVNRKLRALTGRTPSQFIRSIRLQKAVELLQTTDLNISEIAYQVGFTDPNYFTRSFSEEFGYPPNVIRK